MIAGADRVTCSDGAKDESLGPSCLFSAANLHKEPLLLRIIPLLDSFALLALSDIIKFFFENHFQFAEFILILEDI